MVVLKQAGKCHGREYKLIRDGLVANHQASLSYFEDMENLSFPNYRPQLSCLPGLLKLTSRTTDPLSLARKCDLNSYFAVL